MEKSFIEFQIEILKTIAESYPENALRFFPTLLEMSKGETENEKRFFLFSHLKALEVYGYIEGLNMREGVDGHISFNGAFRITEQGLREVGVEMLRPDPDRELREALIEQAGAIQTLSEKDTATVRKTLSSLPRAALERLMDKGLDTLLRLLFG